MINVDEDHLEIEFMVPLRINPEIFEEHYKNIVDSKTNETRPRQVILEIGDKPEDRRDVEQDDFDIDANHIHGNRQYIMVQLFIPFSWISVNFDQVPLLARPFGNFPRNKQWRRLRRMVDNAIDNEIAIWRRRGEVEQGTDIIFSGIEGGGVGDRKGSEWGGIGVPRDHFEFNPDMDILFFHLFVRMQRQ